MAEISPATVAYIRARRAEGVLCAEIARITQLSTAQIYLYAPARDEEERRQWQLAYKRRVYVAAGEQSGRRRLAPPPPRPTAAGLVRGCPTTVTADTQEQAERHLAALMGVADA